MDVSLLNRLVRSECCAKLGQILNVDRSWSVAQWHCGPKKADRSLSCHRSRCELPALSTCLSLDPSRPSMGSFIPLRRQNLPAETFLVCKYGTPNVAWIKNIYLRSLAHSRQVDIRPGFVEISDFRVCVLTYGSPCRFLTVARILFKLWAGWEGGGGFSK